MKYTNAYNNGEVIVLEYREDGIRKSTEIFDFQWYLVVKITDFEAKIRPIVDKMIQSQMISKYELSEKYAKLYTQNKNINSKYSTEKDGKTHLVEWLTKNDIKIFEGDISSAKRYCLDNDIEVAEEYEILYFDIETDDSNPVIEIGKERILSIAAVDSHGEVYYMTDKDEKKILQQFVNLISRYDVISGWNSAGFDLPYIKMRMQFHSMRYFNWRSIAHVDLMQRFIHIFRFDNNIQKYSLEYISNHFLGVGKVKHVGKRIIDLYNLEPDTLKQYNIQDTLLLKKLDDKIGCINMMILQCIWCRTFLSQFFISELLDNYLLRIAHQNNIYCPSRNFEIEESQYAGGYVLTPIKGVYSDVFVFDFKSLYPTLMMTSNIGFDTICDDGEILNPGTGKRFTNKFDSVIKLTIEGLIGKRKEYKKKKLEMIENGTNKGTEWERVVSDEIVVKELSNSVYGIMGKRDSRWYSLDVAESITKFGQWTIKWTRDWFNSEGFNVIYGDTDSLFVQDTPEHDIINDLHGVLNKYHIDLKKLLLEKYGIIDCRIELEDDKQFSKFILVDKKTYTGHAVSLDGKKTNQIYTRGIDYIKKSSISVAADTQLKLIKHLLYDDYTIEDCEKFVDEILECTQKAKLLKDDLIIQVKLSKPLSSYTTNLPHVIVGRKMVEKSGVLESNEIEYIVIDNNTKQYILPDEYRGEYDRLYYWNNRIFPLLERILRVVFPNGNWGKYKYKSFAALNQMTLFEML